MFRKTTRNQQKCSKQSATECKIFIFNVRHEHFRSFLQTEKVLFVKKGSKEWAVENYKIIFQIKYHWVKNYISFRVLYDKIEEFLVTEKAFFNGEKTHFDR